MVTPPDFLLHLEHLELLQVLRVKDPDFLLILGHLELLVVMVLDHLWLLEHQ